MSENNQPIVHYEQLKDAHQLLERQNAALQQELAAAHGDIDQLIRDNNLLRAQQTEAEFSPVLEQCESELEALNQSAAATWSQLSEAEAWRDRLADDLEKNPKDFLAYLGYQFAERLSEERQAAHDLEQATINYFENLSSHATNSINLAHALCEDTDESALDEMQARIDSADRQISILENQIQAAEDELKTARRAARDAQNFYHQGVEHFKGQNSAAAQPKKGLKGFFARRSHDAIPDSLSHISFEDTVEAINQKPDFDAVRPVVKQEPAAPPVQTASAPSDKDEVVVQVVGSRIGTNKWGRLVRINVS